MKIASSMPVTEMKLTRSVSVTVRRKVRKRCPTEMSCQTTPWPKRGNWSASDGADGGLAGISLILKSFQFAQKMNCRDADRAAMRSPPRDRQATDRRQTPPCNRHMAELVL